MTAPPSLRPDLPFRRIALVLSGGGALGAYEVGVLKVLERLALAPALIAGVSSGAVNAVAWVAHGRRSAALERTWLSLRASSLGMRWVTLLVRALGVATVLFAALEVFLTVAGSPELGVPGLFGRGGAEHAQLVSVVLDAVAWGLVGIAGGVVIVLSRYAEAWLARVTPTTDPQRWHRRLGQLLLAGAAVHATTVLASLPWPHRFSASALAFGFVLWLANRPGRAGRRLRGVLRRLLPETGGRGLWGSAARRRMLEELVAQGDAARLTDGTTQLSIGALALDTGRTCHFVTGFDPSPEFRERIEQSLGEVITARRSGDVVLAAVASSAIPGIFEPVRIGSREFVDPGGFSNQPLHAAIAAGADAAIIVLLAPSEGPAPAREPLDLVELGGRLLEIANWRDLQAELRSLPPGWAGSGTPARVCVVEPRPALPGAVMDFEPAHAVQLIRRGEEDAWGALERAGWLAGAPV
ncbi:MAG TPA: patatin-like phospholipase family protein [Candidatus Eisenbacteria bacterium]